MGGRGATSGLKSSKATGGGGGSSSESKSKAMGGGGSGGGGGGASSKQYDVDTNFTNKEIDGMSRKKLESIATKIGANNIMKNSPGMTREQATQYAKNMLPDNSTAQLRKLIKNYKKRKG